MRKIGPSDCFCNRTGHYRCLTSDWSPRSIRAARQICSSIFARAAAAAPRYPQEAGVPRSVQVDSGQAVDQTAGYAAHHRVDQQGGILA